jgi:hypothetical protein
MHKEIYLQALSPYLGIYDFVASHIYIWIVIARQLRYFNIFTNINIYFS